MYDQPEKPHVPLRQKTLALFRFLFACVICLLALSSMQSPSVHAISVSTDPQVLIATDITSAHGSCRETTTRDVGTRHEVKVNIPCPQNTFLQFKRVLRSQAIAIHEPYVLYPLTPAAHHQAIQQLQQLAATKHQQIRRATTIMPATIVPCGSTNRQEKDLTWQPNGNGGLDGTYFLSVFWFVNSDCSIAFDEADVNVRQGGGIIWEWDQYSDAKFDTGCPVIQQGYYYWHTGNYGNPNASPSGRDSWVPNLGYEMWFGTSACRWPWGPIDAYIYPIYN